ncbi:solute carrier family 35 member C2-like [Gigantopelta aegis]|uniref:solute carrier family 35 member C2-like n=1 Tax=Gigantopelta aegis TaxID=1735272 RepID=UPI001B88A282|nr:solute carrier family 35 member C2-like [Gigantopelta aegis]
MGTKILEGSSHVLDDIEDTIKEDAKLVKKSICSLAFFASSIKLLGLVLFYYTFSIGLTFYNKKVFKVFKFPLSVTVTHLVVKFMFATVVRCLLECKTKESRITLGWGMYFKRVAPTGVVSALDIGLSNWSLEFITISLYTMSKSTAILFILLFSLLFKLEQLRCSLLFIVVFISGGLFMFTYHATAFDTEGFILVMVASFLSGLRWTLAQIVTQKNEIGLHNPLDMMYHVQPWMILGLLPLSAVMEGLDLSTSVKVFHYEDVSLLFSTIGLVLLGAFIAFFLEFSEYLLLSKTSSLTLSVSGVLKEVCTLYIAHLSGDTMNTMNAVGLVVCLCGIVLHIVIKAVCRNETTTKKLKKSLDMEMLIKDGRANTDDDDEENCDEIDIFDAKRDR